MLDSYLSVIKSGVQQLERRINVHPLRLLRCKCDSKILSVIVRRKLDSWMNSFLGKKRSYDSSFCKKEVDSLLYDLNKNVLICTTCVETIEVNDVKDLIFFFQ